MYLFTAVKINILLFTEVWPWCRDPASAWATSGPGGGQQCQKPSPAVGQHLAPNCQQRGPEQLPDPPGEALIHLQLVKPSRSSLFALKSLNGKNKLSINISRDYTSKLSNTIVQWFSNFWEEEECPCTTTTTKWSMLTFYLNNFVWLLQLCFFK